MAGVIEQCAAVVACASTTYSRPGSNAQKEWVFACEAKKLGASLIVVELDPKSASQLRAPHSKKASMTVVKSSIDMSAIAPSPDPAIFGSPAMAALVQALERAGVTRRDIDEEPLYGGFGDAGSDMSLKGAGDGDDESFDGFYEPAVLARNATTVLDDDAYVEPPSDAQYGTVINAGL